MTKPNDEGSSIGVRFVLAGDPPPRTGDGDSLVLVERYIGGLELTVSVLGNRALEVTEIVAADGWYDYAAKYQPGGSRHVIPARIPDELRATLLAHALGAHKALGCRGVSRADFRFDPEREELAILEVNTQPGITPTSLVPEQAERVGISFPELVEWLVEDASCPR